MENGYDKFEILISAKRYNDAESMLKEHLSLEAYDTHAISILSRVYEAKDELSKAISLIQSALSLSPDNHYYVYLKASYLLQNDDIIEADKLADFCISKDPYSSDYYTLKAAICISKKQFKEGLKYANKALEINPENVRSLNLKSTAHIKLGDKDEASQAAEGALNEDPDDSFSHASTGWNYLEAGNVQKALEHFKESLRLDASNDIAREGIIEALKSRNFLYKKFLSFQFWLANKSNVVQWIFVGSFFLMNRILKIISKIIEGAENWVKPAMFVVFSLAIFTWVIEPLSNLILRFDKFGKYALNDKQKWVSNFVLASLFLFTTGTILYVNSGSDFSMALGYFGLTMMIPLSGTLSDLKNARMYNVYALVMLGLGVFSLFITLSTGNWANVFSIIYIIGLIGYQFIANRESIGKF
ncbi:MAG: hypothetical protein CMD20_02790 [Flavobacteriales bacterium]|nr:hypothetical protein [Flavobacteriales bacterium]|tara:strand:+ start:4854 stop:6098 length:1245 start_codon:yes stop_codon:yes gene_type:complete